MRRAAALQIVAAECSLHQVRHVGGHPPAACRVAASGVHSLDLVGFAAGPAAAGLAAAAAAAGPAV